MTHPAPETLAEFIDGKLRGETRDAVVEHIEECDECLMIVGETARLFEEEPAPARRRGLHWAYLAAAVAAVIFSSIWIFRDRIFDPLTRLAQESRDLRTRPLEARLEGFDYRPFETGRGTGAEVEPRLLQVRGIAGQILERHDGATGDARRQHAAGVAALIAGDSDRAVVLLQNAVRLAPRNTTYWSDLSAALLESARTHSSPQVLPMALSAADQALLIDAANRPALFDRALILESMKQRLPALGAYDTYLKYDSDSEWAGEVRARITVLRKQAAQIDWPRDRMLLRAAASTGDAEVVERIVSKHRTAARGTAELLLLSDWATATLDHNERQAEESLGVVKAIAVALQKLNRESLLAAVVRRLETATPRQQAAYAAAQLIYRQARDLYREGKYEPSLPLFQKAAAAFRACRSPMAGMADYYAANCLYETNRTHEASVLLDELLRNTPPEYIALRAQLHWEKASVLTREGQLYESLFHHGEALRDFDLLGEDLPASIMRSAAAATYSLLGRDAEAWKMRLQVFESMSAREDPAAIETRQRTLELAARTAALSERWTMVDSLLSLALEAPCYLSYRARASAWMWRALAACKHGDAGIARQYLARADPLTRQIEDKSKRVAAASEVAFASAIINDTDSANAIRRIGEFITAARHRSDLVYVPEALLQRARLYRLVNDPEDAIRDLRDTLESVAAPGSRGKDDYRDSYFATEISARRDLVDVYLDQKDQRAAFAAAQQPADPPFDHRAMSAHTALIQYVTLESSTIIFAVTQRRIVTVRAPVGARALTDAIHELARATILGEERRANEVAETLANQLLTPVAHELTGNDHVVFVPDGPLSDCPFGRLPFGGSGKPLFESATVSVAMNAAGAIRKSSSNPQIRSRLLVVGNASPAIAFGLPPLPQAEVEATEVANLYGQSAVTGAAATKELILARLPTVDVAHFATHGVLSTADPSASFLLIASPDDISSALYMRDIAAIDLSKCRLIVLVGCRTGANVDGGGVYDSMARSFLRSGAGSVVASLWDVDDTVGRAFAIAFHRHLLDGATPAEALRKTQTSMRHSSDRRLSAFRAWSGLVAYGRSF